MVKGEDIFGKSNVDAADDSHHTIGPLGEVVVLKGHAQLGNAEAQQDQTDGMDHGENRPGPPKSLEIICRKGRIGHDGHSQHQIGENSVDPLGAVFNFRPHCITSIMRNSNCFLSS